ncbi:hypothetical protein D9M69_467870 [compost metagenome]
MHPGQGHRQLHLHEGRRRAVQAPRPPVQALRRRRGGDGLRRSRPGRHPGAQGRNLPALLRHPGQRSGLPAGRHHLRPEHLRRRHRHRGTQQLRGRLHQRLRLHPRQPALRAELGRGVQRVLLVPWQQPGARGDPLGVPLLRDQERPDHGHRQRRSAGNLRRDSGRAARQGRGRGAQPQPGRHRSAARHRRQVQGRRRGQGSRGRGMAQP